MMGFLSRCDRLGAYIGLVILILPATSHADVSVTQQAKSSGNGPSGGWTKSFRIKGLRLRLESQHGSDTSVYIYDLEAGKRYRLDPKRKEIFVDDLESRGLQWRSGLLMENRRKVIKSTGGKTIVGGRECDEYTFDLQAPTRPSHGIQEILHDTGTVCVSQTIPGGAEFTRFVQEAQKRGYISAAAVCSPTTSPVGAFFYGEQPNVVVLSSKSESAYDGGPLHSMTGVETSVTVTAIDSDPIPDEAFQIPLDWKTKKETEPR